MQSNNPTESNVTSKRGPHIKYKVPCPHCGAEHWHSVSSYKVVSGITYYTRVCRTCGHQGRTDSEGNLRPPQGLTCPDCGNPWKINRGAGRDGRQTRCCRHCGRKGVTDTSGNELTTRLYRPSCPDCSAVLRRDKKLGTTGAYYTCSGCHGKYFRRYGKGELPMRADSAEVELMAAEKAKRVQNAQRKAEAYERKLAKQRVKREAERKVKHEIKAMAPPVVKKAVPMTKLTRAKIEDLRMERELLGQDPLYRN